MSFPHFLVDERAPFFFTISTERCFDDHLICGHRNGTPPPCGFKWLADSKTCLVKEPPPHGFVAENWSPGFFRMILSSHVARRGRRKRMGSNDASPVTMAWPTPSLPGKPRGIKADPPSPQKLTIFYGNHRNNIWVLHDIATCL